MAGVKCRGETGGETFMRSTRFPSHHLWERRSFGAADVCTSVCIHEPRCVVWPPNVFSIIHISTVNSAGSGRHTNISRAERKESNIHESLLPLAAIHDLQLYNAFHLCFPKTPFFYFTLLFSILHGRLVISLVSIFTHLPSQRLLVLFFCLSVRAKRHSAGGKAKRGRSADLFVINWHAVTIDYWTWPCLFQRNPSAVTSPALLQQGQRTQRETNQ